MTTIKLNQTSLHVKIKEKHLTQAWQFLGMQGLFWALVFCRNGFFGKGRQTNHMAIKFKG